MDVQLIVSGREREKERESAMKYCKIIIREKEADNYVCTLNHVQANKFKLLQKNAISCLNALIFPKTQSVSKKLMRNKILKRAL